MTVVQFLVALLFLLVGAFFIILAIKVMLGSRVEYERNRDRSRGFVATLRGQVSTLFDQGRDHRVAAGIAVDKKTKRLVTQGRLSEDSMNGITHR